MEPGQYHITYKTSLGQIVKVNFALEEDKIQKVDLCLDTFSHSSVKHNAFIDQIQNGERITMDVLSSGCFHHSTNKLIITREADKYFLEFKGKQRELTPKDLDVIRKFETELVHINSRVICTSSDIYTIRYKNQEIHIDDDSCMWNGWYGLKKDLGLTEK